MALMDAGIPVRDHVAGVSVGLISDVDPSTGAIKDYRILTDILVSYFVACPCNCFLQSGFPSMVCCVLFVPW